MPCFPEMTDDEIEAVCRALRVNGPVTGPVNPAVQSISAFFPCYNDEATIGRMVDAAAKTIDECDVDGEVIVINDGSTDGSPQVLADLQRQEPRLRVVTHEAEPGLRRRAPLRVRGGDEAVGLLHGR